VRATRVCRAHDLPHRACRKTVERKKTLLFPRRFPFSSAVIIRPSNYQPSISLPKTRLPVWRARFRIKFTKTQYISLAKYETVVRNKSTGVPITHVYTVRNSVCDCAQVTRTIKSCRREAAGRPANWKGATRSGGIRRLAGCRPRSSGAVR